MITDDNRCTWEIKSRIAVAEVAFKKRKAVFPSKWDLNLRKKLEKLYVWCLASYGAETWILQMHVEICEMWCWRRMEKISWTDRVRNVGVLLRGKEERNIIYTVK